jgi:hypothetical protein
MWLVLAVAVFVCDPPNREVNLLVVDAEGALVSGAEVRAWSGGALVGVTDTAGSLRLCASPGTSRLGVSTSGFQPRSVRVRRERIVVTLTVAPLTSVSQASWCVTGSARDGSYRLCGDVVSRLPLRF